MTAEDPTYRRRRRRRGGAKRRPRRRDESEAIETRRDAALPDWQWRTFPVFFAFVVGIVVMGIAIADPTLSIVIFYAALIALAGGLAHLLTRALIARRRR